MTNLLQLADSLLNEYKRVYDDLANGKNQLTLYKNDALICETRDDHHYYRIINPRRFEGKPQYKGSLDQCPEVRLIAAYKYYESAIKEVTVMIKALERLKKVAVDIDPNFYPESMPTAYQIQPPFVFDQMGVIDIEAWQTKPRRFSERNPDDKIYRTKNGWMVRSKSEVMWADGYSEAGIPCFYEALRNVGGKWLAPDFLALCTRKWYQEMTHEHCGKMDDPDYVTGSFLPRLSLYLADGYIPGVNLLFTFETKQTPLTPQMVSAALEQYF